MSSLAMTIFFVFISALFSAALGIFVFWRESKSTARSAFVAILALLSLEALLDTFSLLQVDAESYRLLQVGRLAAASLLPGMWLLFSLTYSRGNAREFVARKRTLIVGAFCLPLIILAFFESSVIEAIERIPPSHTWFVGLGTAGIVLQALFLMGAVLSLMNLERTYRTATGTMRWRIKYLVLGCGVLLGSRIFTSSQAILFHGINFLAVEIQAIARLVGYSLIGFSFVRSRLAEIEIYPSHTFLHRSITVILAGSYILVVGVLGKLAETLAWGENVASRSFMVLVALVGLAVLLMSDRMRQKVQHIISRHLRRPFHDYRRVWTLFAERTTALVNRDELCREVASLVSETFSVLSVTIFVVNEQKNHLIFGASTSMSEAKANEILRDFADLSVLPDWGKNANPIDLDQSTEKWVDELAKLSPVYFTHDVGRICVPLVASGQFLGIIMLTDRVSHIPFSQEDLELLKCAGGQVAASLLNIQLSASLLRSKELEAFQTMSTFFVHDLKNTALMLSLMLKNLPVHFANPDFREDSLRAIGKTVDRINDLIGRLSLLRKGLEIQPVETDLNALVAASLGAMPRSEVPVQEDLQPLPKIPIDAEQFQKVFVNLVLNAREAIGDAGQIRVATSQSNGWAVLQVTDNGCGMSPDFMQRSLFRPFQTTKKKGIGIGMYQSKMIVEAHSGKIEVQSGVGTGTTFRVLLPIKNLK